MSGDNSLRRDDAPSPLSAPSRSAMLTARQIDVLRWLATNPNTRSGWLVKGKPARGQHPDKWDQLEISGPLGSIRVDAADLKAIRGLVGPNEDPKSIHGLNAAGRAALAEAEGR